jgi:hypothetical protein
MRSSGAPAMIKLFWASAAIVALCGPGFLAAQPRAIEEDSLHRKLNIQATVGQDARVYSHLRLSRSCGQGPLPKMTITMLPSGGMLTTRTEVVTLTAPNFGNCAAGHSGNGTAVYYTGTTPGKDAFEYQIKSPGLPTTTWSVTVDVQ